MVFQTTDESGDSGVKGYSWIPEAKLLRWCLVTFLTFPVPLGKLGDLTVLFLPSLGLFQPTFPGPFYSFPGERNPRGHPRAPLEGALNPRLVNVSAVPYRVFQFSVEGGGLYKIRNPARRGMRIILGGAPRLAIIFYFLRGLG